MTRKIEQQMLAAIRAGRSWQSGNTMVCGNAVSLHGHHIATILPDGTAIPNRDTFHRWPTSTTRSRLRALGIDVSIKRGVAMIGGKPA